MQLFRKLKVKFKNVFKKLGPGIITGASDDDPSGIATYSQAGAAFGYSLLWLSIFTLPLVIFVQEMCGRIGIVTGKGLAALVKTHYPKVVLYFIVFLLFFANSLNIGANLGAMASSIQLFVPLPFWFLLILIAVIIVFLEIKIPYTQYKNILKYLTLSLFAYAITFFLTNPDMSQILKSMFIPNFIFTKQFFLTIVAILGTTISPYLFFWQTGEEVEELVEEGKIKKMGANVLRISKKEVFGMRIDTVIGMFYSNAMMYFIMATSASTLHNANIFSVETATEAARALRPLGGELSFILFVLGILGTGLLSIPILAGSASYAISETFGFKEGLYNSFTKAKAFYLVISIATLLGIFVNLLNIKPFLLLFYSAVINGIASPFLLVFIMLIINNKKIMKDYTNNIFSNIGGIVAIVLMFASILALIFFSL
ncbi:Nramp family divalent metal transporter [Patescibacteria group bacterium]|nr:Nramp family divalent metal transporter [Patescibacteria group bacterium]